MLKKQLLNDQPLEYHIHEYTCSTLHIAITGQATSSVLKHI